LQAGGVAAEFLKTGIADGDGSTRTVKLQLHTTFYEGKSPTREQQDGTCLLSCYSQIARPNSSTARSRVPLELVHLRTGREFKFDGHAGVLNASPART
jgi:hypothetical protein